MVLFVLPSPPTLGRDQAGPVCILILGSNWVDILEIIRFQLLLICCGVDRSLYILSALSICLPYAPSAICRGVIKENGGDVEITGTSCRGPL